jgi:hypothetical protein
VKHRASEKFWRLYDALPREVQRVADKNFELLKENPRHPSLHLKKVGRFWSVRIGGGHRAVAVQQASGLVWFWIGDHDAYDRLLAGR